MKTAMTKFNDDTSLLIQGVKGKFDEQGNLIDNRTREQLAKFVDAFIGLVKTSA
jgi:chromate reductase